jgi:replicative DNA helicase
MQKNMRHGSTNQRTVVIQGGKNQPSSVEAERAVLGSVLLHDEHLAPVLEILIPADFYLPTHQTLFALMLQLFQQGRRLDVVTLQDELDKIGQLDAVGGVAYLVGLQEDIAIVGLLEQHAKIVKEKAVLRQLIASASTIISNCYAQDERRIDEVLDEAEKTIMQIAEKRSVNSFIQLPIWLKRTFQHLSSIKGQGGEVTGIASHFRKLDAMTSGFHGSDFIVLAARPSMGKTALALRLAQNAAASGHVVGIFSLEMSAEQLVLRLLSIESGIPHHHIRNVSISSDEWVDLTHVAARLAHHKIFIDDSPTQTILHIRTKARKLKREHNLQLLVIDYLQLITSSKQHENRHQEVSEISRSLKALAKELNIPIIALSQLSRAVDGRVDKRPMLSDLRESGAIEQDADLILFLYRDVVYNPETQDPSFAELIIGKQRNGPTGMVPLTFHNELTLFQDMDGS